MKKYTDTVGTFISGTGFMLCLIGAGSVDGVTNFGQSIWPPVLMMAAGAVLMYLPMWRRRH